MSIVTDIVSSFYSAQFYNEVARVRRGIGMKFITVLTLVTVLLLTGYFVFYSATLNKIAAEVPNFAGTLPAVTIKDGKLSIDKPMPYTLPIGKDSDRMWIIVNTNYKIKDIPSLVNYMETNKVIMLLTAEECITLKRQTKSLEIQRFSEFKQDVTITHANWMTFGNIIADKGVKFLIIMVFAGSLIGLFIYNFLATVIGAVVMMIIAFITRAHIEFGAAMRLTAAARMPFNAIVSAPLMIGGGAISGIVGWLVWLGYLIFAAVSSKRQVI